MINVYEYLKRKGYDIEKKWHKITIGQLIEMLTEYENLKNKENGGRKTKKGA
jgi:hypothetical protein